MPNGGAPLQGAWFLSMKTGRHPEVAELCDQADPASDVEHFVVCPVCGQIFDCRDDAQVSHHTEALHEPLTSSMPHMKPMSRS